jgi:hypothetical protein
VIGAVASPVLIVGFGEFMPFEWIVYGPFLIVSVVAVVLWIMSVRPFALGFAVGTAGFAAFLFFVAATLHPLD